MAKYAPGLRRANERTSFEHTARITVGEPPGGLPSPICGLLGEIGCRSALVGALGHSGQFVGQ